MTKTKTTTTTKTETETKTKTKIKIKTKIGLYLRYSVRCRAWAKVRAPNFYQKPLNESNVNPSR